MPNRQTGNFGMRYIDRGDIASNDFEIGDLTLDGNWHDLDLSGIIPTGKLFVKFTVVGRSIAAGRYMQFKVDGYENVINIENHVTQAANIYYAVVLWLISDNTQKIQYRFENATWNVANITVLGWFV